MFAETIAVMSSVGSSLSIRKVYENITVVYLPVTLAVDSKGPHKCMATNSHPNLCRGSSSATLTTHTRIILANRKGAWNLEYRGPINETVD